MQPNQKMNLKELSIEKLKSTVYDLIAMQQGCQRDIEVLNAEIAKRNQEAAQNKPEVELKPVEEAKTSE